VLRHPIAVACATQKWSGSRPHQLIRHWIVAHEMFAGDAAHLRDLMVVHYEDMVADPDECFGRVFSFLGLDDPAPGRATGQPAAAGDARSHLHPREGINERYFASWDDRRRRQPKRLYLDLVEHRYERRANRFGYSLRRPRLALRPASALPATSLDPRHAST
jgi:hypothetical protein